MAMRQHVVVLRRGIRSSLQHQRKGKESADAEAAQEKPDMQYDNPMMQQQQQRQHRLAAAVESYDVFDTGAERTVSPGGGKDTQYGNPILQHSNRRGRGQKRRRPQKKSVEVCQEAPKIA
jgi:hypothetical protein